MPIRKRGLLQGLRFPVNRNVEIGLRMHGTGHAHLRSPAVLPRRPVRRGVTAAATLGPMPSALGRQETTVWCNASGWLATAFAHNPQPQSSPHETPEPHPPLGCFRPSG
jgi:hypothetical protein